MCPEKNENNWTKHGSVVLAPPNPTVAVKRGRRGRAPTLAITKKVRLETIPEAVIGHVVSGNKSFQTLSRYGGQREISRQL